MSINITDEEVSLLTRLIRKELSTIRFQHWGYFFPCSVAVWRFIELKRPNVLGPLEAGFDLEPYFSGKGADWFCSVLLENEQYLDLVESVMTDVVIHLRRTPKKKDFAYEYELPELNHQTVKNLVRIILESVDNAIYLEHL